MQSEEFYSRIRQAAVLESQARYDTFAALHKNILAEFETAVCSIDETRAESASSDGRSIKQVVGHIMEWDRYMIQAAGEYLSGVQNAQLMSFKGYHPLEGETRDFASINSFNAFQAAAQADQPWEQIQSRAITFARILYRLFTTPGLLDAPLLDATAPTKLAFPGGVRLKSNDGWQLWMIVMEHEGVEHMHDLAPR